MADITSLHPDVQARIREFAEEVRDDIEYGRGLRDVYGVQNMQDLLNALATFESSGVISDRNSELIDDYIVFLRSSNIIREP